MSTTVAPGDTIRKDPDAVRVVTFDWTDWLAGTGAGTGQISTSSWVIAGPDVILTKASETIVSGNLKTTVKLSAGTLGRSYTLTNRIVTNESPAQTDDRSITIDVRSL